MDADIKVTAQGDMKALIDAMNAAGGATDKFAAKATKNLANVATKIKASTATAGFALTNLGRVAQDLPFGFVSIQNNLNPLLESFQALRKESGSNALAFKALLSSLKGAGGIGLALSVISAAVTILQNGFGAWTRGLFSNKEALDANAKATKAAADAYDSIIKSLAEENVKISVIIEQLKSENLSRKQREEAIKQLQRLAPAYFSTLNTEKASIEDITIAYNKYAASITRAIEAKVREGELTDITEKIIKLEEKGKGLGQQQVVINGKLVNVFKARVAGQDELNDRLTEYQRLQLGNIGLSVKEIDELENLKKTRADLIKLIANAKGADVFNTTDTKKDLETISDVLKNVRHQIDDVISPSEDLFGLDKAAEKVGVLGNTITHLLDKFKASGAREGAILSLGVEIDEIETQQRLKTAVANISAQALATPIKVPLEVTPLDPQKVSDAMDKATAKGLAKLNSNFQKTIDEINEDIAKSLKTTLVNSISGIASAIGETLARGGDLGKAIFGNLFQVLAEGIKQIGESLIALGTAKVALEKFKFAPGVATIAAGFAAVLIGSLLKNAIPQFATGGFVSGPGTSTSDSIPARLSKGEYVINAATVSKLGKGFFDNINGGARPQNNQFASGGFVSGAIGGGQLITVEVIGRQRGKDIYWANKNYGLARGRAT